MALINLLFRYPIDVSHELGSDTTFVHSLAASIIINGHATWTLHPFSYFGLYALSYPSAVPFLFASSSQVSGGPIEAATLAFGWIVSVAACWGGFLFARALRRDDVFALLVALLFPLAPFFIKDTFWVASTRGFVVGLLPVFILLLTNSLKRRVLRDTMLAFGLFILLATIHRMGVLSVFLLVAFVFAIPFHKLTNRLRFALVRYEQHARYTIAMTAVGVFFGVFYLQFLYPGILGPNIVAQYSTSALFNGDSFPVLALNMGVSLSGKVGPLFLAAPLGLLAYVWRRPKEATDKFILTATILFLPLLSLRDYIAEFLIPLFVILAVVGLFSLRFGRRKLLVAALALFVAGSMGYSWEMKDYWREQYSTDAPIPDSAYAASIYVRHLAYGTIVSNDGLLAGRLAAFTGMPVLPLGGASLHWTGPQELAWRILPPEAVGVQLLPLTSISFNTDEIYIAVGLRNVETDWETMLYYADPPLAEQQFAAYDVHYFVVEALRPTTFLSYSHDRPSAFLVSILPDSSYQVFENGAVTVWFRG
jgi:hypothetical protein